MPYSAFVIVALVIHILTNIDMFVKKDNIVAVKQFRVFVIVIALFYITDILWGIFESNKLSVPLYVDTIIYFIMMGAIVLSWTMFVTKYLEGNKVFSEIIKWTGIAFFTAQIVLLIINVFKPILFNVDSNSVYTAYGARNVMLYAQIGLYAIVTLYSIIYTIVRKVRVFRRYIAISLFSIVMITCIAIQLGDPYIPLYSIGCLIGACILDTFGLSDTKERFKNAYQETSKMNEENKERLGQMMTIAYTDPLTGVKSRHACVEEEIRIDKLIATHKLNDFAIVVFDLNGLKNINDTYGHEAGDRFIIEAVKIITTCFPFETIYRYGGDEFIAILEGKDAQNRQQYHNNFMDMVDENAKKDGITISSGMSKYRKGVDNTFKAVFYRADKMMYSRKEFLKEHN